MKQTKEKECKRNKEVKYCKYDQLFTLVDIKDMEIDWSKYGENNDSNMKAIFLRYEIVDDLQQSLQNK